MDSARHAAVIEAAQSGDQRAREELVAAYLPLVYNIVGRALNGHADVDDVVQETMIRALGGLASLRDPGSFRSWLVAITMNQIRGRWQAHHAMPPAGDLGDAHDVADPRADFVDLAIVRMGLTGQRREVAEATRWLDEDDRELLSLWWLEAAGELTRAEVAAAMELSQPHTAVRVQRMKAQLEIARTVVRALSAVPRCVLLEDVLRTWDGVPSALWRKRLARHARECTVCSRLGDELVPAEGLLVGLGLLPVGAALAELTAARWSGSFGLAAYGEPAPGPSYGEPAPGGQVHDAHSTHSPHGTVEMTRGPARSETRRRERRARRRRAGAVAVAALLVGGGTLGGMTLLGPDDEDDAVRAQAAPEPPRTAHSPSPSPATESASPSASASAEPSPSASPSRKAPRPTPSRTSARPAPPPVPSRTTRAAAPPSSVAQQVTELVNAERAKSGCGPVRHDDVLATAALRHSEDMDARDYFDHTSPDGAGPGERITAAGYEWSTYGENIARGQRTPDQVMQAWMDSPGHRANILNCDFEEMGIGLHEADGGPWWTQVFGTAR